MGYISAPRSTWILLMSIIWPQGKCCITDSSNSLISCGRMSFRNMMDMWSKVQGFLQKRVRLILVFLVGFSRSHLFLLSDLSASFLKNYHKKGRHAIVIYFLDLCFRAPKSPIYYLKPCGSLWQPFCIWDSGCFKSMMTTAMATSHPKLPFHLETWLNSPSTQAKKAGNLSISSIEMACCCSYGSLEGNREGGYWDMLEKGKRHIDNMLWTMNERWQSANFELPHILDFNQIEESLGSKHESSRNDEAPLAAGANPAFVLGI